MVVVGLRLRLALPLLAAILLMGCQPVWVPNGTPTQPLAVAVENCQADANKGFFGRGIDGFMNYRAYVDRCIASNGYRQVAPGVAETSARP